ncbi:MAG: CDP-alcohol phosphatidyltransferase family protein [bacterium]
MADTDFEQQKRNSSGFLTIPNLLSISRLILLPLVLFFLFRRQAVWAVAMMLLSWSTDALDGYLARRLNQVSDTGRVLDHLVDKIWVAAVLTSLIFISDLPRYLAVAVIGRDLLILAGSAVVMKVRGSFVSSDVVGKITGCAFALLILFYTLRADTTGCLSQLQLYIEQFKTFADYTVLVLTSVSFLNYLALFLRLMVKFRLPGEWS